MKIPIYNNANTGPAFARNKCNSYDNFISLLMMGKKNVAANRMACSMVISKIFRVFSTNVDSSLEKAFASKPNAQEATDSIVNLVESFSNGRNGRFD